MFPRRVTRFSASTAAIRRAAAKRVCRRRGRGRLRQIPLFGLSLPPPAPATGCRGGVLGFRVLLRRGDCVSLRPSGTHAVPGRPGWTMGGIPTSPCGGRSSTGRGKAGAKGDGATGQAAVGDLFAAGGPGKANHPCLTLSLPLSLSPSLSLSLSLSLTHSLSVSKPVSVCSLPHTMQSERCTRPRKS
jgi:hypothetical protein